MSDLVADRATLAFVAGAMETTSGTLEEKAMSRSPAKKTRRSDIIEAAVTVVAREGWAGASIDEITRQAGVSRGLVSYHFRDKADLLAAVLDRCQRVLWENVVAAASEATDAAEALRLATRKALGLTVEEPELYRIFMYFSANASAEPELDAKVRRFYADLRQSISATIRSGQQEGHFRNDLDADAAAARHISVITGLALQYLVDPAALHFQEAARQAEDSLLDGLRRVDHLSEKAGEVAVASGA